MNGYRVDEIIVNLDYKDGTRIICNKYLGERTIYKRQEIRAMVTKEQFEEMEYRVDE